AAALAGPACHRRSGAQRTGARVAGGARIAVVALVRVRGEDTARGRDAGVVGALVGVVADGSRARLTGPARRVAGFEAVAGVAVAAHDRRAGHTAAGRRARLDTVAGVAVVAGERRSRDAAASRRVARLHAIADLAVA